SRGRGAPPPEVGPGHIPVRAWHHPSPSLRGAGLGRLIVRASIRFTASLRLPPALGCSSWTISATCSLTSQISSRSPFTAVSTLPSRSGNPGRPGTPGLGASPNQSSKKCPILRATRNNARSARHRVTSAAAIAPAPTIHSPRAVASGGCIGLSNIHFGDSPLSGMSLLYNQYASLASRWPAHEDMLISRGPGSTKAPGGYRGCAGGSLLQEVSCRLPSSAGLLLWRAGGLTGSRFDELTVCGLEVGEVLSVAVGGDVRANDGREPVGAREALAFADAAE